MGLTHETASPDVAVDVVEFVACSLLCAGIDVRKFQSVEREISEQVYGIQNFPQTWWFAREVKQCHSGVKICNCQIWRTILVHYTTETMEIVIHSVSLENWRCCCPLHGLHFRLPSVYVYVSFLLQISVSKPNWSSMTSWAT